MMKSTFHDTNEVLQLKDEIEARRVLNFVCWGTIGFLEDTFLKSHKFEEKDVEQLTTMVSNTLKPYIELYGFFVALNLIDHLQFYKLCRLNQELFHHA